MSNHFNPSYFREGMDPRWVHENPLLEMDFTEQPDRGSVTLRHLSRKKVLRDQRLLNSSHFENIPWHVAKELWEYLCYSGNATMYMWKIFTARYPSEFRKVSSTFTVRYDQKMMLSNYFSLMKSNIENWGVAMTIRCPWKAPELVNLTTVENLVALQICDVISQAPFVESAHFDFPLGTLNDRIVRSWSESSGAFQHLQILRINGFKDVSKKIFEYLEVFPSLRICVLDNCQGFQDNDSELVTQSGWRLVEESNLSMKSELISCMEPDFLATHSILNITIGPNVKRSIDIQTKVLLKVLPSLPQEKKRKVEEDRSLQGRMSRKPALRRPKTSLSNLLGELGGT